MVYHFCGPYIGPLGITLGLPFVCYLLIYCCNERGVLSLGGGGQAPGFAADASFFTIEACLAYFGFLGFQLLLHFCLPGKSVKGVPLEDKSQLDYKMTESRFPSADEIQRNVFSFIDASIPMDTLRILVLVMMVTNIYIYIVQIFAPLPFCKLNFFVTLAVALGFYFQKPYYLSWIYDQILPLTTVAIGFAFTLSLLLFIASYRKGVLLAKGGDTPSMFYNFFIGRELNPRILGLDIKHFTELYPGLIGWMVIDIGFMAKQYEVLGRVTPSMYLVCLFHSLYVLDALWHEASIFTTMDIIYDGLGFMLVFGNLAWVPLTYSLQARYLVQHENTLSWIVITGLLMLNALGYLIFRCSNNQKNLFRRWSWCLPCGFSHVVPYFYVIYFSVLLVHRERRDNASCQAKYGDSWTIYCREVRSRIIPLIY